jgi:hypothetical protein
LLSHFLALTIHTLFFAAFRKPLFALFVFGNLLRRKFFFLEWGVNWPMKLKWMSAFWTRLPDDLSASWTMIFSTNSRSGF